VEVKEINTVKALYIYMVVLIGQDCINLHELVQAQNEVPAR